MHYAGYVTSLGQEFDQKVGILQDDAAFLLEVKERKAVAAAEMDADFELEYLKLRFQKFQKEFQVLHFRLQVALTAPLFLLTSQTFKV